MLYGDIDSQVSFGIAFVLSTFALFLVSLAFTWAKLAEESSPILEYVLAQLGCDEAMFISGIFAIGFLSGLAIFSIYGSFAFLASVLVLGKFSGYLFFALYAVGEFLKFRMGGD